MMKDIFYLILLTAFLFSCETQKQQITAEEENIEKPADKDFESQLKGRWVLEFMSPITGKDVNHFKIQKPFLEFVSETEFYGNNGCNNIASTYETDDDKITFYLENMKSTKMFCQGVDEEALVKGFRHSNRFKVINGKNLALMEGDAIILSFKKVEEEE